MIARLLLAGFGLLALEAALTSAAVVYAESYYFQKGKIVRHTCDATDRDWLAEWTSFATLDLEPARDTITLKNSTAIAEGHDLVDPYAWFHIAPQFTLMAKFDLADCADVHCASHAYNVRVDLIKNLANGQTCFDEWRGVIVRDGSGSGVTP